MVERWHSVGAVGDVMGQRSSGGTGLQGLGPGGEAACFSIDEIEVLFQEIWPDLEFCEQDDGVVYLRSSGDAGLPLASGRSDHSLYLLDPEGNPLVLFFRHGDDQRSATLTSVLRAMNHLANLGTEWKHAEIRALQELMGDIALPDDGKE